ncbi:hypothetical protein QR685DRAFT_536007, partial [Neurospora intermedia]
MAAPAPLRCFCSFFPSPTKKADYMVAYILRCVLCALLRTLSGRLLHTYLPLQIINSGPRGPPFSFCHPTSRSARAGLAHLPWRTTRNMDLQGTGSVGPTNTGRDLRLELPKLGTPRPV